jgi:hypothetical protein
MRKLLLILIPILFITISYSNAQSRLGYSFNEIKTEFKNPKYKTEAGLNDDNDPVIIIHNDLAVVFYYFNNNYICNLTIILPKNDKALNVYVENYNNKYVVKSSTSWNAYIDDSILNIKLVYPEDGGYFFTWELLN